MTNLCPVTSLINTNKQNTWNVQLKHSTIWYYGFKNKNFVELESMVALLMLQARLYISEINGRRLYLVHFKQNRDSILENSTQNQKQIHWDFAEKNRLINRSERFLHIPNISLRLMHRYEVSYILQNTTNNVKTSITHVLDVQVTNKYFESKALIYISVWGSTSWPLISRAISLMVQLEKAFPL